MLGQQDNTQNEADEECQLWVLQITLNLLFDKIQSDESNKALSLSRDKGPNASESLCSVNKRLIA